MKEQKFEVLHSTTTTVIFILKIIFIFIFLLSPKITVFVPILCRSRSAAWGDDEILILIFVPENITTHQLHVSMMIRICVTCSCHEVKISVITRVVSSEIYPNLSRNLLNNFFHLIRFNYNHIKINNKHIFDKQISKSLYFNFMHYVQEKITCF